MSDVESPDDVPSPAGLESESPPPLPETRPCRVMLVRLEHTAHAPKAKKKRRAKAVPSGPPAAKRVRVPVVQEVVRPTTDPIPLMEMPKEVPVKKYKKGKVCEVPHCRPPFPPNTTFYKIPNDPVRRKVWSRLAGFREDKNGELCSNHFAEDDFERNLMLELLEGVRRDKLKPTAVPSRNLRPGAAADAAVKSERAEKRKKRQEIRDRKSMVEELLKSAPSRTESDQERSVSDAVLLHDWSKRTCGTQTDVLTDPAVRAIHDQNLELRSRVLGLQRELQRARAAAFNARQRSPGDARREAKQLLSTNTCWSDAMIDCFLGGKRRGCTWSDNDIALGKTLYGLSRKAFLFLRKSRLLPLPGLATINEHDKAQRRLAEESAAANGDANVARESEDGAAIVVGESEDGDANVAPGSEDGASNVVAGSENCPNVAQEVEIESNDSNAGVDEPGQVHEGVVEEAGEVIVIEMTA